MMNNYTLPTCFEIEEELFEIRDKGDYRIVLSCFNIICNVNLSDYEKSLACLVLFYSSFGDGEEAIENAINCSCKQELLDKMYWFFDCGNSYDKSDRPTHKLVDWDKDSLLICSAINRVAGKDVRSEEYIHWWTFIGYYMEVGECALSQILGIRSKIANGVKLEKHEQKFKNDNPQYFDMDYRTEEDKKIDAWLNQAWDGEVV